MFSVDRILSIFTFLIARLEARERVLARQETAYSNLIKKTIQERSNVQSEMSRAQVAKQKLKEFCI